ncbi:MAG: thiamine phosphate synthase [Gemmatimonadota bacterium]
MSDPTKDAADFRSADGRALAERLSLMVITDPGASGGPVAAAKAALEAGAPAVQLRWKDGAARELLELAGELRRATHDAGALFLVNDRVDIALAVGADGCHLGDDDIPLEAARRIAPPGFIIGRSVDTPDEARIAEAKGATYVGMGPVFPTGSKSNVGAVVGEAGITAARAQVRIPIVAIGGIGAAEATGVARAGADGIAVISAVMHAPDPGAATRRLLEAVRMGKRS